MQSNHIIYYVRITVPMLGRYTEQAMCIRLCRNKKFFRGLLRHDCLCITASFDPVDYSGDIHGAYPLNGRSMSDYSGSKSVLTIFVVYIWVEVLQIFRTGTHIKFSIHRRNLYRPLRRIYRCQQSAVNQTVGKGWYILQMDHRGFEPQTERL